MRITDFQIGDIIQRTARCQMFYGAADGSYMNQPMRFEALEGGIIFLTPLWRNHMLGPLTLNADEWANDWDLYPIEVLRKLGVNI